MPLRVEFLIGSQSRALTPTRGVLDFASDPYRNPSVIWSLHKTEPNGYELLLFGPVPAADTLDRVTG